MFVVLRVQLRSLDKSASANVFTILLCSMLSYTFFDMLCGLIENGFLPTNQLLSSVLNVGFFWSGEIASYMSFAYGEYELARPWIINRRTRRIGAIPLFVTLALTVLTLKFKFFYYIDERGVYFKGPYYVPVMILAYGYIALIGVIMLFLLSEKCYYVQRHKIMTLASFVIYPLAAGLFQSTHTGVSVLCMGGTVAVMQVFINIQETRITLDPLTRMNNRTRLMQVLESSIADKKQSVCFVMMDIDHFKEINDKYGHLEGDAALMDFAETLKTVCGHFEGVLARYGGDEFAVVLLPRPEDEVGLEARFRAQLGQEMEALNQRRGKPYTLYASVGFAKRSPRLDCADDLIAAADEAMYMDKMRRHELEKAAKRKP